MKVVSLNVKQRSSKKDVVAISATPQNVIQNFDFDYNTSGVTPFGVDFLQDVLPPSDYKEFVTTMSATIGADTDPDR